MLKIPSPVLQQIHDTDSMLTAGGERLPLNESGGIAWDYAEVLYNTVKSRRPRRVLEIGMASGISTLSILTALQELDDGGSLVSIDPYQSTLCKNTGVNHVKQAGLQDMHQHFGEFDYVVLPRLLSEGAKFDLIYIDGNHDFEFVILDSFYADLLLPVGGLVGFNDCGWQSVHAAMRHVPPSDRYEEIDVGLKRNYRGRNALVTMQRRLVGRSSPDRYFRKQSDRKY
jgi:predicted O-methyltransferase YrrM